MKPFVLVLLLVLILPASSLLAADPQPVATDDPAWKPLFTALAAKGPVFASFTESRWSKLRKTPVVLAGEMRLSPDHGLSLRYTQPSERLMVIDARGILLRDAAGRTREITDNANTVLLPVLRFDLPALTRLFDLRGTRDDTAWRVEFIPRDAVTTLKTLVVTGSGEAVTGLEFSPAASQRIEIAITGTRTGVPFTADELTRFFR